jgi:predicted ATP-dependent endonuclease of OLD family
LPSDKFCEKLTELQLNMFFLGDNRILKSDILPDDDDNDLYEKHREFLFSRRRTTSSSFDVLDDYSLINRDIVLKTSIKRTQKWISDQTLTGTSQGEANVHNVYEEIITEILQNSEKEVIEELPKPLEILIKDLINADNRSKDFSRFGLMSPLDSQNIVNILESNSKGKSTLISSVLKPYLDSVSARFDALQDTQKLLTTFESTINKFFHDKYIKLHVRDGIKIFTDENLELSPEKLSSGEKQLLLLFCNTLTARDKATIFIIDEPEISLNVKWQRQLIHALLELTKGSQVQFILATHSMELLTQYRGHVIKLVKTEQ